MSYSQIGQDTYFIEQIINGKRNGFFLDIGANDGKYHSNTYLLETEYNWTGICIEANPYLYNKLVNNRPNSKCIHKALYNSKSVVTFDIPKKNLKNIKGNLLSRISDLPGNEKYFKPWFEDVEQIKLETCTLTELLQNEGQLPVTIDYMSLDTEGAELSILEGIDFKKINIKFMTIEHGNRKQYKKQIIDFLSLKGYKVHRINKWDVEFELE